MTPPNPHPDHPAMSEQVRGGVENPAAFPCTGEGFNSPHYTQHGMTLRDWFAGQALAGLTANHGYIASASWESAPNAIVISRAFSLADAMLAARAQVVS